MGIKLIFKNNFEIVWQSSTAGHTELARIVSYYRFLNTDPVSYRDPRYHSLYFQPKDVEQL
jgi:hypothetical protein